MPTHLWLRAEDKAHEERTALTPRVAHTLIEKGFKVTVEKSGQAAIPPAAFQEAGCELAEAGEWKNSPRETIILGLKELDVSDEPLIHRHIHFAHVYKNQTGWQAVLQRFVRGGGVLYDLEFLTHEDGRRVAAFGYWAGYAGAAVGLMAWCGQELALDPVLTALSAKRDRQELLKDVVPRLETVRQNKGRTAKVLVMGALGRSGCGAVEFAQAAGADVTAWDLAETQGGGPFEEILAYDLLINCVFVQNTIPPFLTWDLLGNDNRRLGVISDVSCDPYGEYNPLPLYRQCTTFDNPCLRLIEQADEIKPLDMISIDHLPSLLPVEASEDFCEQLAPYLLQLDDLEQGVWARAHRVFQDKTGPLR